MLKESKKILFSIVIITLSMLLINGIASMFIKNVEISERAEKAKSVWSLKEYVSAYNPDFFYRVNSIKKNPESEVIKEENVLKNLNCSSVLVNVTTISLQVTTL